MANNSGKRTNQRLADLGVQPAAEPTLAELCPPDERTEYEFPIHVSDCDRIIERLVNWKGDLVEFAIIQQRLVKGEWRTLIRADTCHDEAHVHRLDKSGAEERRWVLQQIKTTSDVETGYDLACEAIHEHWEENVRRWEQS